MSRVFFTDRDLGKRFPDILASAGLLVERHGDHFPPDCPDEVWLGVVGARGWVALTHNSRIRYTPNELRAVMEHSVALLVLVGKSTHVDLARSFIATLGRIETFLDTHDPPFIAKVYRPSPELLKRSPNAHGRIELWHPAR